MLIDAHKKTLRWQCLLRNEHLSGWRDFAFSILLKNDIEPRNLSMIHFTALVASTRSLRLTSRISLWRIFGLCKSECRRGEKMVYTFFGITSSRKKFRRRLARRIFSGIITLIRQYHSFSFDRNNPHPIFWTRAGKLENMGLELESKDEVTSMIRSTGLDFRTDSGFAHDIGVSNYSDFKSLLILKDILKFDWKIYLTSCRYLNLFLYTSAQPPDKD